MSVDLREYDEQSNETGYQDYVLGRDFTLLTEDSDCVYIEGEELKPGKVSKLNFRGRDRVNRHIDQFFTAHSITIIIAGTLTVGVLLGYAGSEISRLINNSYANEPVIYHSTTEQTNKIINDLNRAKIWNSSIETLTPISPLTQDILIELN